MAHSISLEAVMTKFVDFAEVKEKISFFDAIGYLKLNLKQSGNQWRGNCPACNSGGDRALVITDGKGWFCFALKKGGDQIALAITDVQLATGIGQTADLIALGCRFFCRLRWMLQTRFAIGEIHRPTIHQIKLLNPDQ